ncbi:MAG TPA: MbtH family protein [Isosphaeraceae bacterium]|jgi:MbtH protein|nr:MbtH family protein [Isosphaeraceae bacterium]
MSTEPREPGREPTLKVVVNHEGQYSLWPIDRANPPGWDDAGCTGTRADCLAFIERNWTDMRPLSLRGSAADAASKADTNP